MDTPTVAAAAAEQHQSPTTPEQGSHTAPSTALTQSKPRRKPRVYTQHLNALPEALLHHPGLTADLAASLPANYSFELPKTLWAIQRAGARRVALQFPEGLLMFALPIARLVERWALTPGVECVVMGDVTYGACCVDDFTARY